MYQTISKFHRKQQSYDPETNFLQDRPVTGIMRVTCVMTIICANSILIQPETIKLWPRKKCRTYGQTTRRLQFMLPQIFSGGIKILVYIIVAIWVHPTYIKPWQHTQNHGTIHKTMAMYTKPWQCTLVLVFCHISLTCITRVDNKGWLHLRTCEYQ